MQKYSYADIIKAIFNALYDPATLPELLGYSRISSPTYRANSIIYVPVALRQSSPVRLAYTISGYYLTNRSGVYFQGATPFEFFMIRRFKGKEALALDAVESLPEVAAQLAAIDRGQPTELGAHVLETLANKAAPRCVTIWTVAEAVAAAIQADRLPTVRQVAAYLGVGAENMRVIQTLLDELEAREKPTREARAARKVAA